MEQEFWKEAIKKTLEKDIKEINGRKLKSSSFSGQPQMRHASPFHCSAGQAKT